MGFRSLALIYRHHGTVPPTVTAGRILYARNGGALVATGAAVPYVREQVDAQPSAAGVSRRAHKPTLPAAVPRTMHVRRCSSAGNT